MAETAIGDGFVPNPYASYFQRETERISKLFVSGLVQPNGTMNDFLGGGGSIFDLPHWNSIPDTPDEIGTDNPGDLIDHEEIVAGMQRFPRMIRTKAFKVMDTAIVHAGSDPIASIASSGEVPKYWAKRYEDVMISELEGIRLAIEAGANDMTVAAGTAGTLAGGAPAAADLVSSDILAEAKYNVGDSAGDQTILACHSAVATNLAKAGIVSTVSADFPAGSPQIRSGDIPFMNQNMVLNTTLGFRVIVSDSCPVLPDGAGRNLYVSYLMTPGYMQYGETLMRFSLEDRREPRQGQGAGSTEVYHRRNIGLHPTGFAYTGAAIATGITPTAVTAGYQASGPTNAILGAAASWVRVFPRRQVGLTFIKTNG